MTVPDEAAIITGKRRYNQSWYLTKGRKGDGEKDQGDS